MTEIALSPKALLSLAGSHPFGASEAVDIHRVGTLEPGKRADVALWDSDLYAIPPEKLKDQKCEMTILNGKIVYRDDHTLIPSTPANKRP